MKTRTKGTLSALLLALMSAAPPRPVEAPIYRELTDAPLLVPSAGRIPVLMYHDIGCPDNRYSVCPQSLYEHLAFMHENGFRAVTIDEYLTADFGRLQEGEKPYMLTFDDGQRSQFFYDDDEQPATASAVGVVEFFRETHNVRVPAYFFVITDKPAFGEPLLEQQKLSYLVTHDFGVGNHSAHHTNLERASLDAVLVALGKADRTLSYVLGENWGGAKTAAFPYGAQPEAKVREAARARLEYQALFHAFGGPAELSTNNSFDKTAINRYETHDLTTKPGGVQFLLDRFPVVNMELSFTQR